MTIVMVETLIILVPIIVLVFCFNVTNFFSCFVNLFMKFKKLKHLLPVLLQLLVDCFEVIDLLIKLLVLWLWADSLHFLVSFLPKERFVPLVGVQGPEDRAGCCCLLQRHDVSCCCGREIT
jgi:hypothetical protein